VKYAIAVLLVCLGLSAVECSFGCVMPPAYDECEFRVVPHQYSAELLFRVRVQAYLEDSNALTGQYPLVYWCRDVCPDGNHVAIQYNTACYYGRTQWDGVIYVADWGLLADGAYIHELGHWARLLLYDDGDADHSDTKWWSLMASIDSELAGRGW